MPAAAAAASAAAKQEIPKMLPKFFHKYVGNPVVFKCLVHLGEKYKFIGTFNNIYNLAPTFKWSLAIVPLYGVCIGDPPVDKLDLNTSLSLTATGVVWMCYAMMIQPQNAGSRALAAVNFALMTVNGYNCYRRISYDRQQKKVAA